MNILTTIANQVKCGIRSFGAMTRAHHHHVSCTNIHGLLLHLCDFDQDMYQFIIKWLAYPLQHEGAKMSTALVINGPTGTGVSTFFSRVVADLYGEDARFIRDHDLSRQYNPWAEGARLVVLDGTLSAGTVGRLIPLVSSFYVSINVKGQPSRTVSSEANFVYASESDNFVPCHLEGRRLVIVEAPPPRRQAFYRAVSSEIDSGGVEVFRRYLMGVDLKGFDPTARPSSILGAKPAVA